MRARLLFVWRVLNPGGFITNKTTKVPNKFHLTDRLLFGSDFFQQLLLEVR